MPMDPEKPAMHLEYHICVVSLTINTLENLFLYKEGLVPQDVRQMKDKHYMFSLHLYFHLHNKIINEK